MLLVALDRMAAFAIGFRRTVTSRFFMNVAVQMLFRLFISIGEAARAILSIVVSIRIPLRLLFYLKGHAQSHSDEHKHGEFNHMMKIINMRIAFFITSKKRENSVIIQICNRDFGLRNNKLTFIQSYS